MSSREELVARVRSAIAFMYDSEDFIGEKPYYDELEASSDADEALTALLAENKEQEAMIKAACGRLAEFVGCPVDAQDTMCGCNLEGSNDDECQHFPHECWSDHIALNAVRKENPDA